MKQTIFAPSACMYRTRLNIVVDAVRAKLEEVVLKVATIQVVNFAKAKLVGMTNKLLILQVELVERVVAPCVPLCVANNLSHA